MRSTTVDTATLINLIFDAGYGASIYRDIDAAVRAWLDGMTRSPFCGWWPRMRPAIRATPADFSYGLYTAVICQDYPQPV